MGALAFAAAALLASIESDAKSGVQQFAYGPGRGERSGGGCAFLICVVGRLAS